MQLTEEQRKAIEWAADRFAQDAIREIDPQDKYDFNASATTLRELLAAHNAGTQEPVAWAVYNGWSKIAFYISEEGARDHAAAEQRMHDLSGSIAAFRVVPLYAHPQPMPQTDAARDMAINELRNIVNAKRFDRKVFECDVEFSDWVQNRVRYTLAEIERIDRAGGE